MAPPSPAPQAPQPGVAAAVLGELQRRYVKWRQRNASYSRLLAFLSFIALLLGVLFLQRGSHTSFEVRRVAARLPRQPSRPRRLPDAPPCAPLRRCTARWRRSCCRPATLPRWTTCTPGCAACWRRCGATPCAATACARAPLSTPSTVRGGAWRLHEGQQGPADAAPPAAWCACPCACRELSPRLPPPAGRFGCRADCGRLQDIQNLTAIRIDLAYDFSHPSASIPATVGSGGGGAGHASLTPPAHGTCWTQCLRLSAMPPRCQQELMQQASWNLCPAGDSSGCYWSSDQTFEQLTGSVSVVVPDVPDGGRPLAIPAGPLAAWCQAGPPRVGACWQAAARRRARSHAPWPSRCCGTQPRRCWRTGPRGFR